MVIPWNNFFSYAYDELPLEKYSTRRNTTGNTESAASKQLTGVGICLNLIFSVQFPIGLHVILQLQIKKIKIAYFLKGKIILTENPSRCNLAPLVK